MPTSYAYQRVDTDVLRNRAPGDARSDAQHHGMENKAWYRKPSIFWLLPVFLLFSLAMGATSMPRMNVLSSLLCRDIFAERATSEPEFNPENSIQNSRRHGGSVGMHSPGMEMNGTAGNLSASSIIIGEYNSICSIKEVESATAMLNLWGNLIAGIIGAIATPFWGKITDQYGRVKPLAAAATVILVSDVVMVLIAKFPDVLPLNLVYLVFVLEGVSGSFILIMALASSYAADCTEKEDRNVALGWLHGSMFFGMAAGPRFGGSLGMSSGKSNPLLIFYTGLAMRAFGVVLLALVPESLEVDTSCGSALTRLKEYLQQSPQGMCVQSFRRVSPLGLLRILSPSNPEVDNATQRNVIILASVNTLLFGAVMGGMNIMMLYSEFRFEWGNQESGIFLSTVNIFRTLATVVVLPLIIHITRRFCNSSHQLSGLNTHSAHSHSSSEHSTGHLESLDVFLLRASIISDTIGYIGYAISPTGALFTLSGVIAALGAIGLATSEASMTKLLPASQSGELLGALGFLQGLVRIVAPTVASLTYSWTAESMPQLVFWGIAMCFAAAGALTCVMKVDRRQQWVKGERGEEEGHNTAPLQADKLYDGQ